MNRILTGLAIAGALVGGISPTAHADYLGEQQYVTDLSAAGVPIGTAAQESYVGELICANLHDGLTTTAAAKRLINGAGASVDEAIAIVGLAVIDICPQYAPVAIPPRRPVSPPQPVPVTIAGAIRGALA